MIIYHFNVDEYREVCAAELFGREFGKRNTIVRIL